MRCVLLAVVLIACKSDVKQETELCAKAAAMFDRCEQFPADGSDAKLQRELVVDRWRGLCRAVMTGETKQLMPDALAVFAEMNEDVKRQLRQQAACTAKTTTCVAYAACSR
jgi:hypothetical protein